MVVMKKEGEGSWGNSRHLGNSSRRASWGSGCIGDCVLNFGHAMDGG
jgi:hypothetical protein